MTTPPPPSRKRRPSAAPKRTSSLRTSSNQPYPAPSAMFNQFKDKFRNQFADGVSSQPAFAPAPAGGSRSNRTAILTVKWGKEKVSIARLSADLSRFPPRYFYEWGGLRCSILMSLFLSSSPSPSQRLST